MAIFILPLIFTVSCSKDMDEQTYNITSKPVSSLDKNKFSQDIQIPSVNYWKSVSELKSANAPLIIRRETTSSDQTYLFTDYYGYSNNLLQYDYKYSATGVFIGAYIYYYDEQGRLSYTVKYNNYGNFESFSYNSYYLGDERISVIAYYTNSYQLVSFYTYTWNGTMLYSSDFYSYNVASGSTFENNIIYNYENNRLISSSTSNGINTYYLTDMYGRIYQEKKYMYGAEYAVEYYRPNNDNTYFGASYFYNGNWHTYEVYFLGSETNCNYDRTNPLNIFRLNFYYSENNF